MSQLANVLGQMRKTAKKQLFRIKENVRLDSKVDRLSVEEYLTAIVQLVMFLAEDVVKFQTEQMKKMDDVIDKSNEYFENICENEPNETGDCVEQFEQTKEKLNELDKNLKDHFEIVLKEKLQVYKEIKKLHFGIKHEVEQLFTEHLDTVGKHDIQYKAEIKQELKTFFEKFELQRANLQAKLLEPLIKVESLLQQTGDLYKKLETHIQEIKSAVNMLDKTNKTFQTNSTNITKQLETQLTKSQSFVDQLQQNRASQFEAMEQIGIISDELTENVNKLDEVAKSASTLVDSSVQLQKIASSVDQTLLKAEQINKIKEQLDETSKKLSQKISLIETRDVDLSAQLVKVQEIDGISKELSNTNKVLAQKIDQINQNEAERNESIKSIKSIGSMSKELDETRKKIELKVDEINKNRLTLSGEQRNIHESVKKIDNLVKNSSQIVDSAAVKLLDGSKQLEINISNMNSVIQSGTQNQADILKKIEALH